MSSPTDVIAKQPPDAIGVSPRDLRPLAMTVSALGRFAENWLNPADVLRQEAVLALQVSTGFTRVMIEQALDAAFAELTEEKIGAFVASEPGFMRSGDTARTVLHILAGNVFTAWLPGAVITLLLGARCDLKPSREEVVFAPLWKRSLGLVDPALGEQVSIVRWEPDLFSQYQAVVAYGSDPTISRLRSAIVPGTRFVGYGHKLSVAVVWQDALEDHQLPWLLDQLEKAAAPFDLQGCLSPQVIYIEGEDPGIFEGLFTRVRVIPRLKRFETWEELKTDLQDLRPYLSTFGYAGSDERTENIKEELAELGFNRVCALGLMQRPPLGWRNGGVSLVDVLTSL